MQRRERFQPGWRNVDNNSDRPGVETKKLNGKASQVVEKVTLPLTEFKVVNGRTMGGGTSVDAVRRARRRLANGH